ncbi:MAG: formate dehydrogenase [Alphaproteobacteria bacterium]|nr:formate dehydrogenase [Alphaproteobacteria bacterium]
MSVIFVPNDSAAVSVGADDVAAAIVARAQEQNIDIEVRRNGSRGMFWLEPLVEIEHKGTRYAFGPVLPSEVPALFAAGLAHKSPGAIDHPKALGPTEQIDYLKNQERLTFARCGLAEPLDLQAYEQLGGLAGLKLALKATPKDIVETIAASGLRGRGGAGFPAGIKWKTVADQPGSEKYICCNADEGDSGTFADRLLMEADPYCLIEGMIIAGLATGAERGLIYLRSEYPAAIAVMGKAIEKMSAAGWLGDDVGSCGRRFEIEVRRGAGAYICGEESSMLESLEGKRGEVRAKPPIPAISGLFGRPTLVNNVLTLAAVPWIMAHGAKAYAEYGQGRSKGTQAFQLGGNIARGGLVEKAFGVTIRDLIEGFGGGTASGKPFATAQLGGPLGAYVNDEMLDLPMDYEALAKAGAMLGHGGIIVFDDQVDMAQMARFAFDFCAIESCGKCTPCRIGAVRGRETLDKIIAGDNVKENLLLVEDLCELMTDGSLCAMGGLTPMPVRSAIKLFPDHFASPGADQTAPNAASAKL